MWVFHYVIFGIPAVLWPFTYLGIQPINDVYIFDTNYVVPLIGLAVVSTSIVMFMIAYASYEATIEVGQTQILLETIAYAVLTIGMYFFASINLVEDTYEYLQLGRHENHSHSGH